MKKFKVKLTNSVKEVTADSLPDLRKKIGEAHSVDPEKFKFIKPMVKVLPIRA